MVDSSAADAFDRLWRRRLYMALSGDAARARLAAGEVNVFAQAVDCRTARRALGRLGAYLRCAHVGRVGWRRRLLTVRERERRLDALAVAAYERLVTETSQPTTTEDGDRG